MSRIFRAAACLALALLLTECGEARNAAQPPAGPKPGIAFVRPFTVDRSVVSLDPGFGFNLARSRVPQAARANSVGRAVQFILTDELEQDLRRAGVPATRLREFPGGLAGLPAWATTMLVIGGRFDAIDEGAKRLGDRARPGQGGSRVVVDAWIDYLSPSSRGAPAQRLLSLHEDSNVGREDQARPADVNADAALLARRIADSITEVARLKGWVAPAQ